LEEKRKDLKGRSNMGRHPDLKIEKGVKMPPMRGYWVMQAMRMEIGDSVEFDNAKDAESLRQAIRYTKKCNGGRPAMRYMGNYKWRVWRADVSAESSPCDMSPTTK